MVKAAIGQMRNNVKKQRERERALSTVTQTPDDLTWRDAQAFDSDDSLSDLSQEVDEVKQQRWSVDKAPALAKVLLQYI